MRSSRHELVAVLRQPRALLLLPDNDYAWSPWEDAQQAVDELDRYIAEVECGDMNSKLQMCVMFAPSGPMQEVSLSSGWGEKFLEVAKRFDEALATADKSPWRLW